MKRFICLLSLVALMGCATSYENVKSQVTYSDKVSGSAFTATDANAIKTAVNDNDTRIDAIEAVSGLVKITAGVPGAAVQGTDYQAPLVAGTDYQAPLVAGTDYQTPLVAGSDYQAPLVAGTDYLAPDGDGSNLTGIHGAYYTYADNSCADQGAACGAGTSIYEILQSATGPTTIILQHTGAAATTNYAIDTSISLAAYPLINIQFEQGARITITTGDETITVYSPGNIVAQPSQQITAVDAIRFTAPGIVTPGWWGADLSGATDSRNAIQYAVNSIAAGSIIDCMGVTLRIDSTVDGKSNLEIRNGAFDFSNAADDDYLFYVSGSQGTTRDLTANISENGTSVTVADSGDFSAGQYVLIGSSDVFDASSTGSLVGEINIAASADAGTITLESGAKQGYLTADTAGIVPLTMIENFTLRNITATGQNDDDNDQWAVSVRYGKKILIVDSKFFGFSERAVALFDVVESTVSRCWFESAHDSGTAYGVSVINGAQDIIISNCHFKDVRHAFTTNNYSATWGIPRRIKFIGNTVINSAPALGGSGGDAVDTHSAAEDIEIINNTIMGPSSQGINVECAKAIISGNSIHSTVSVGIAFHNESDRAGSVIVSNNFVRQTGGNGIQVIQGIRGTTAIMNYVSITGNVVSSPTGYGIGVDATNGENLNVSISGNSIYAPSTHGIYVSEVRGVAITGNSVRSPGTNGIRLNDSINAAITGNVVNSEDASDPLIYLTNTASGNVNSTVSGNTCGPLTSSIAAEGIEISNDCAQVIVIGNNTNGTGGVTIGTGTGNVNEHNI